MKKKLFIPIIVIVLVLIIGVIGFIIFNNNKVVSTVTLDINPSIEINLNSNEKVVSIKALNDDAKDIVNDDLKGKSLEDSLNIITDNLIDKGYAFEGDYLEVILYSEGDISNSQLEEKVTRSLREKNIGSSIVIVDEITDEDKDLAEKYNISPAKVSYIKTITNDNEKINIDDLANKSVKEIVDTKEHGLYCDKEYTLEGNVCLKEIDRVPAQKGEVCPGGYQEYNGVCYEETGSIEGPNDYCPDEFEMVDGKCKKHSFYEPLPNCKDNRYDSNSRKCIELVYVEDAIEFCRDPGRTLYDHKCLATKPSINGGCLGNDMYYNGKCLNPINDYYMSEYKCSNGQVISGADGSLLYGDTKCYEENPVDATYLECDRGFTFDGINCVHDEEMNIQKERICPSGYTKIEFDRCINLNNSSNKTDGYVCTGENERPAGNECIIYEVIDAIQY